jgi:hypothetical protein
MMEAASTSETSVNFYQITRRYNPEDSHLHIRSCKNLKSYYPEGCLCFLCWIFQIIKLKTVKVWKKWTRARGRNCNWIRKWEFGNDDWLRGYDNCRTLGSVSQELREVSRFHRTRQGGRKTRTAFKTWCEYNPRAPLTDRRTDRDTYTQLQKTCKVSVSKCVYVSLFYYLWPT